MLQRLRIMIRAAMKSDHSTASQEHRQFEEQLAATERNSALDGVDSND